MPARLHDSSASFRCRFFAGNVPGLYFAKHRNLGKGISIFRLPARVFCLIADLWNGPTWRPSPQHQRQLQGWYHRFGWRWTRLMTRWGALVLDTPTKSWLSSSCLLQQNLGAVLRSAYFLGAAGVLACKRNSAPLSGVVSKASAGALEAMTIRSCNNLPRTLQLAAENGWQVTTKAGGMDSGSLAFSGGRGGAVEVPITSLMCLAGPWSRH